METEVIEGEPVHALELVPKDMQIARSPERVLTEAREAALALKDVLSQKKNKFMFRGEQYLQFEDWQTLGRFYGVTARIKHTQQVTYGESSGFEATAEAVRADGMVISAAEAMCMDDEVNWKGKPIFQIRSMAQTRACAKALRNVLSWVAVLAGYAPTPAEEMTGQENSDTHSVQQMKCPDCGGQMWDNRKTKKGKQPDYKCKDKACNKAVWLDSESRFTERKQLVQAVTDVFKLLNAAGDDPKWTARRANEFVAENFDGLDGVDALDDEQLNRLAKLLSDRLDALKGESGKKDWIVKIQSYFGLDDSLKNYLDQHYGGKQLEDMTLAELRTVYDDVSIPF